MNSILENSKPFELVYFGEEYAERAPAVMGNVFSSITQRWVSAEEFVETIRLRIPLLIRPATESEMNRAEAATAIYEIGQQLGQKIDRLLDQHAPESVQTLKDKLAECDPPLDLLDRG
jgi:hypothetical protein